MHTTYSLITPEGALKKLTFEDMLSESPRTLLYFYPKDNTPGCTLEAQDFTRLRGQFEKEGIRIVGVSSDNEASHLKFHTQCALGIDLVTDTENILHTKFQVIGEKKNYGKTYIGVIRSTFLLNSSGEILQEWRNVKATGHAEKVWREMEKK